ncbi:LytR C-terminal domain-containing protein [Patescibacteria group bacterium]|nr:LytR C-terminal domain-containing protein [Patescibacteria group bacterium]
MRSARRPRSHISRAPKKKESSLLGEVLRRLILIILGIGMVVVAISAVTYLWILPEKWSEETVKNIVIIPKNIDVSASSILFASLSYKQGKLTLNSFPANDAVEVPGGYGQYPLKSVYPLLGLDEASHQKVVATYSFLIGAPIDEVWISDDERVFHPQQSAGELARAILLGKVQTDLGVKDRIQLYQFIQETQPEVVRFSSLLEWQEKQTSRYAGRLKNCRVALVNTTNVTGLGRKVSQVLERSGVVVVRLTDATPTASASSLTIQPDQPDCVELAEHLKQLFPNQLEVHQDPGILNRSRSEAEVVLGEDLGEFLE